MNILKFYINPIKEIKLQLTEKEIKWKYPVIVYSITYLVLLLAAFLDLVLFHKSGFVKEWYQILFGSLPFVLFYSLTGFIYFRSEGFRLKSHIVTSIYFISYILLLVKIMMRILNHIFAFAVSDFNKLITGLLLLGGVLISKVVFNLLLFSSNKKSIVFRSIIELLTVFILCLFYGAIMSGINSP